MKSCTLIVALAGALAFATAAYAGNGATPPGESTASTNSSGCSYHGSFGAFGQGFNWGNSTSGHAPYLGNYQNGNGANGPGTGANNSAPCGNNPN